MIKHIAFIMDGNRRYAEQNNISKKEGYEAGMQQFINFIKYQIKHNIYETSFFALSNDNYEKRPLEEMKLLTNLILFFSKNEDLWTYFQENKIFFKLIGDIDKIKQRANQEEKENARFDISELTKKIEQYNNKLIGDYKFKVNIAINYGGQDEIVYAFKNILKKIDQNQLKKEEITTKTIKENIYFSNSPPAEIIVRTGDAPRLSGFMLYDSAYSEVYLTKKMWPELNETDFTNIIEWFKKTKRNFGK